MNTTKPTTAGESADRAANYCNDELSPENERHYWDAVAQAAIDFHEAATPWLDEPNEQGSWWFTRLDEEGIAYEEPFHINVMWSGTSNTFFVAQGQWGWTRAQDFDEMPGKWQKVRFPAVPPAPGREGE